MCGIVGATSKRNVNDILLQGLKRLEYRGYDSAGLALIDSQGQLSSVKCEGKVQGLVDAVQAEQVEGMIGIAHTRWATHGKPSEKNAHPHKVNGVAIVHNGIIENFEDIKNELIDSGSEFLSDTDSEVIAHLMAGYVEQGLSLKKALVQCVQKLKGAFAIAAISDRHPDRFVVAREGSPLVIGLGIGENFIGSDALALQTVTNRFIYLEEGDIAEISIDKVEIFDENNQAVERETVEYNLGQDNAEKGRYRHFMEKEIFEQPRSVSATLENRISDTKVLNNICGLGSEELFKDIKHVQIVACGTSFHAGLVAKYWFESIAKTPCQVEVASEYRYREKVVQEDGLILTISQSGETADTLAALKDIKDQFKSSLAICNVHSSSLVRESDYVLMTNAGAEIGVASTKAFTTQLVALLLLVISLAKTKGLSNEQEKELVGEIKKLPNYFEQVLALDKSIEQMAESFAEKRHALFLGRGVQYPIALEGALKLKEISYIHAEAYPAGELKHGPLALVDKDMPVITVAPNDELYEKLKSNLQEVASRGGELFVFIDEKLNNQGLSGNYLIGIPSVPEFLAPIVYTLPLQLLSYYVALIKGTDVDQPRNLAKSVTVE